MTAPAWDLDRLSPGGVDCECFRQGHREPEYWVRASEPIEAKADAFLALT